MEDMVDRFQQRLRAWSLHCSMVIALSLGLVSLQTQPVLAASHSPSYRSAAKQLLQVINADRAKLHVRPLTLDTRQSTCSQKHSKHMAVLGTISHDQFPSDICVSHALAGENVGAEAAPLLTAVLDINASMMDEGPCPTRSCPGTEFADHGHYMNLMNPAYTHIGIGIAVTNGTVWLTENFTG